MAEIMLLHSSCCMIGDLTLLCHWHKNDSPLCKVSTVHWVYHKFPVTWLQQLYTVWDCITVLMVHTPLQMFMPLPANSLMHVTTNVHICFWISMYEYNADDSYTIEYRCHCLTTYWHTVHFAAPNEDGCVHCITAHFE